MIGEQWVRGGFPLCHMHLSHRNILFDDDYNIVGICNWSGVQFAPVERLTMTQEFATFPTANARVNQLSTMLRKRVAAFIKREEQRSEADKRLEIIGLADFMLSSRWDITVGWQRPSEYVIT
jgi:isoamyl acetate esterase